MRQYFAAEPKAANYIPAGVCLGLLVVLLWRGGSVRKRWIILGGALLASSVLALLAVWVSAWVFCGRFQPGIGIRRERDRLLAEASGRDLCPVEEWKLERAWGAQSNPIDVLFPRIPAELVAESETRFFERLSGVPITFSRDARGKVTGLTMDYRGRAFSFEKVSDEPPKAPEPPKRPVAITVDAKVLDACAGQLTNLRRTAFIQPG